MNRVTPRTPLEEIVELMRRDGYVLMEKALTPQQVKKLSAAHDRVMAENPPAAGTAQAEIKRILEYDPIFEQLMDLPTTFPVARALIGANLELATSGELYSKPPHTPAHVGWHNDFVRVNVPYPRPFFFWVRCTYFISDVTHDMGPFTLVPGTHLAPDPCPEDYGQQPRELAGQIGITGPAGSCLINNTEIWHTSTPNRSDTPRRLIMVLYKPAWWKQDGVEEGYGTTPEFTARQTDPVRQQLCGLYSWSRRDEDFPAYSWKRGE